MKFDLDFDDRRIIHFFVENNMLSAIEAVIFTLVFTRPIGRDRKNLANLLILYRYEELTDVDNINNAIDSLVAKGYLNEIKQGTSSRVECTDPIQLIRERYNNALGEDEDKIIQSIRQKGQGVQEYLLEVVGWANSKYAGDTYFQAIIGASKTIKLPVFSFATHGRAKEYIEQAIEKGVDIKLLMYSPELALKSHGIGRNEEARNSANEWVKIAKKHKEKASLGKIEIRIIKDPVYSFLAGALLVDDQMFRYDIYYPKLQRGHEGLMIQGRPYQGDASNLYNVLNFYFDNAWETAERLGRVSRIMAFLKDYSVSLGGFILIFIGILTLIGYFPIFNDDKSNYGLFFISLGLFPALSSFKMVLKWLSKFEIRKRR